MTQDTSITPNTEKESPDIMYSGPIHRTNINGHEIILLGTAHVSKESVEDVIKIIDKEKPSIVAVELCEARLKAIQDQDRWKNLDIVQVIKEKKIFLLMSSLILSAFQKKIGDLNGVKPGEEMLTAISEAKNKNLSLSLIDRDAQITLKRAWQQAGFFGRMSLMSELVASLFVSVKPSIAEIEKMKQGDIIDQVFLNLPYRYNVIKKVIIEERDQYLAQKLLDCTKDSAKSKIIAVVGAGHIEGIKKYLVETTNIDLKALEFLKKPNKLLASVQFILPIIIIASIFVYFGGSSITGISKNILAWCVIKAGFSAFASLLFLPHPLTVMATALVAPISNFNPILKPGWVAALIEAKFHKPKVADFETFAQDTETLKGMYTNKVSRIFGLLLIPQFASSIATGVALWYIAK